MGMSNTTCPNCGGTMTLDAEQNRILCPYCGHIELIEHKETPEEAESRAERVAYARMHGVLKAKEEHAKREKRKQLSRKLVCGLIIALIVSLIAAYFIGQIASRPQCDPFDYIDVSFSGTDGYGTADIKTHTVENSEIKPSLITYTASKQWLSEGDEVTITARSEDYRLTQSRKTFTVSGLDLYIQAEDQVTDAVKQYLYEKSMEILEKDLYSDRDFFSSANLNVDGYTLERERLYLITKQKDNMIVDVYRIHFTRDEYEADRYGAIAYYGCIVPQSERFAVMTIQSTKKLGDVVNAIGAVGEGGGVWGSYAGVFVGYSTLQELDSDLREKSLQDGYTNLIVIDP